MATRPPRPRPALRRLCAWHSLLPPQPMRSPSALVSSSWRVSPAPRSATQKNRQSVAGAESSHSAGWPLCSAVTESRWQSAGSRSNSTAHRHAAGCAPLRMTARNSTPHSDRGAAAAVHLSLIASIAALCLCPLLSFTAVYVFAAVSAHCQPSTAVALVCSARPRGRAGVVTAAIAAAQSLRTPRVELESASERVSRGRRVPRVDCRGRPQPPDRTVDRAESANNKYCCMQCTCSWIDTNAADHW